jgi:hypothetical protein
MRNEQEITRDFLCKIFNEVKGKQGISWRSPLGHWGEQGKKVMQIGKHSKGTLRVPLLASIKELIGSEHCLQ